MRVQVRFGDDDRKALGIDDETLYFDPSVLTNVEAADLDDAGVTYARYQALMHGEPRVDDGGRPVRDEKTGEQLRRYTPHTDHLLAWLAMSRAGVAVPYRDLRFNYREFTWNIADEPSTVDGEGKDEAADEDPTSEP